MVLLNKKILSMLVMCLMFGAFLAACGNDLTPQSESTSELDPYEIRLIYPGTIQPDQKEITNRMNIILQEKINATIDIDAIDWGQWDERKNLIVASREAVDIFFTAQWNGHPVDVAKGAFLQLDKDDSPHGNLLEQYDKGILETLDPAFLAGAQVN